MTRREEIVNHIVYQQTIAAFEYANQHFDINKISERNAAFNGFETGAEWMQKKMIDKACEWIESYLFDIGFPDDWCRDSANLKSGKQRFIEAMEE